MSVYSHSQWRTFLAASPDTLLRRFAALRGAVSDALWTYVPGSREPASRVLLCAHADTVARHAPRRSQIRFRSGSVYAPGRILGADDRAGVALLWALRSSGHSLLLTDLEELGGLGAEAATRSLGATLGAHAFAVQFDRRGSREGVFYPGTHSDAWEQYLAATLPGWRLGWGSYTDIATICPSVGLCGVNLAVGFTAEHTSRERLSLRAWEQTYAMASEWLSAPTLPKHTPDPLRPRSQWRQWVTEPDDVDVVSDVGRTLYRVSRSECPPKLLGNLIGERELMDYWGYVQGRSSLDRCPECGLSLSWLDAAHPDRCPDCGSILPDTLRLF